MFAQIWVLGDNATELAEGLAESQGRYTLTETKELCITSFSLVHRITHSS